MSAPFPDDKEAIERFIVAGTLTAAKFMRYNPYNLAGEPVQNPENDFDFTLPTKSGSEYLDLAEVAPLDGVRGYANAPANYNAGEFAESAWTVVKKKAAKYGMRRSIPVHLLLYSTDFRFNPSERVILLLQSYCARRQHRFRTVLWYRPIMADEGCSRQSFRRPPVCSYRHPPTRRL